HRELARGNPPAPCDCGRLGLRCRDRQRRCRTVALAACTSDAPHRPAGTERPLVSGLDPDWADLPPEPDQAPGPDGVKPVLQRLVDAFPDIHTSMEIAIAEEHRVAVRVILSGTHLGSLLGIQRTGRKITL